MQSSSPKKFAEETEQQELSPREKQRREILQALAASGGPTPRGTTRGLKVTRRAPNGALTSWVPELSAPLHSGDVLHVPESLF